MQEGNPASGAPSRRGSWRPASVRSWLLVGLCCSLLVVYLILHAREVTLILAWLASP
jgi:hypothetical protein